MRMNRDAGLRSRFGSADTGATPVPLPQKDDDVAAMRGRRIAIGWAAMTFGLILSACEAPPRGATARNNLATMRTSGLSVVNRAGQRQAFTVWLAESPAEHTVGLMNVTDAELGHGQGMLFVFDRDEPRGFWMRNTIIPLDIAYIRSDGTIVKTYTMKALDESTYDSIEPARFALEVRAGQFAKQGIREGSKVQIPANVLNSPPSSSE
jgi:hypothetical protein